MCGIENARAIIAPKQQHALCGLLESRSSHYSHFVIYLNRNLDASYDSGDGFLICVVS
jgi:hypothetical protein